MKNDPGPRKPVQSAAIRSHLVPTPKITSAGHARSVDETYSWIKPLLRRVPITRVANVSPLSAVSLPVWSAVTPLARDLTVHAGKGTSSRAAQVSAMMEAIERTCAETIPEESIRWSSYETLASEKEKAVLDPASLNLPFESRYVPERTIRWTVGYDIAQNEEIWVPVDAVISPSEEGVCCGVETNGLAAGNTVTEAILHALYELIERDASAIEQFFELHSDLGAHGTNPPRIIQETGLPASCQGWVDQFTANGLRLVVQDITSDIGVPVFAALIVDRNFPTNEGQTTTFVGHGCDLDSRRAVFRAITEVAQSHAMVLMGSRDAFEGTRPLPNRGARLRRRLDILSAGETSAFREQDPSSSDILTDIRSVVERLASVGLRRCIAVSLTRDDLGVPVVRVIVPGLEPPYGHSMRRPGVRLLRSLI